MSQNIPNYLRLHQEEETVQPAPTVEQLPGLESLCRSISDLTGWKIRLQSTTKSKSAAWSQSIGPASEHPSYLTAKPDAGRSEDRLGLNEIEPICESLAQLANELQRTRFVLWQREAEIAAAVPVSPREDEPQHLAERLEAILRCGAQALGCQAAAAYLLDDATSELKMRTAWGLPPERFLEPARPLRGAVADLEALVGHAVIVDDQLAPHWRSPEQFASSVCVPLSSPTTPLGTVWFFANRRRDFSDQQTNMMEIVAGRLATELEREVLLHEGLNSKQLDREMLCAAQWQADRLPTVQPLLDDWQIAGWARQAGDVGGGFYDWCILPDGMLAVAVGDASGSMIEASMTAAVLHSSLKSHACYRHDSQDLVGRVNETLWTSSSGDQLASLCYAKLDPDTGTTDLTSAGKIGAMFVGSGKPKIVTQTTAPLGTQPENGYRATQATVQPGQCLIILSDGLRNAQDRDGFQVDQDQIAKLVAKHADRDAAVILEHLVELLGDQQQDDYALLIVRRV